MKFPKSLLLFSFSAAFAAVVTSASSADSAPPGKVLDRSAKDVTVEIVNTSLIGYRNTQIFYAFNDQKAVLSVLIDNKDKSFPVSATIYEFADDVTAQGIAMWINNQHSDGLFVDVPEPVKTHRVPDASCKTTLHKLVDTSEAPNGISENYEVTFEIKAVPAIGGILLKDFTDKATVRVMKE